MFAWIVQFIQRTGVFGVAGLMFVENIFPPIPSEVIMPFAGFTVSKGELNFAAVVAAGTVGSIAGAGFWYGIGRWLGLSRLKQWAEKHGRWITLAPKDLDKAVDWFERHGNLAVCAGRLVPGVRTVISIPAGVLAMPFARFFLYSLCGTAIWTCALAAAGYYLGENYEAVAGWLGPVSEAIIAVVVAVYLYRVVTFRAH